MVPNASEVWEADLALKVKEPLEPEFSMMRPDQVLFTYLHLAASKSLTARLLDTGIVGTAYETVQLEDGTLPLLVAMSEVAGRLAVQAGATRLNMIAGGKGILLPGVSGVRRGRVTIIDIGPLRLGYVRDVVQGYVTTLMSNAANIEEAVAEADLVICAVLIPGAKTPRLVTRRRMGTHIMSKRGRALLRGQYARCGGAHGDAGADQCDAALRGAAGEQRGRRGVAGE